MHPGSVTVLAFLYLVGLLIGSSGAQKWIRTDIFVTQTTYPFMDLSETKRWND